MWVKDEHSCAARFFGTLDANSNKNKSSIVISPYPATKTKQFNYVCIFSV
jgi:hypothetical protein